jgi:hypothetical protein
MENSDEKHDPCCLRRPQSDRCDCPCSECQEHDSWRCAGHTAAANRLVQPISGSVGLAEGLAVGAPFSRSSWNGSVGCPADQDGFTRYPDADQIRLVMDNLSTHTARALYETFPAPEAYCIPSSAWSSIYTQARQLAEYGGN